MRSSLFLALALVGCGARTGAIGDAFDDTTVDASIPETSDIDAGLPEDASHDVPDVARRACPGTCSSTGRGDAPMQFSDTATVGIVINGRWRACGYSIGPDGSNEMVLDFNGADGTARFLSNGSLTMQVGAHVNVINRNTTLFSLEDIDSAAYALAVWGCPNGTLRFSGMSLYDIFYVAEP